MNKLIMIVMTMLCSVMTMTAAENVDVNENVNENLDLNVSEDFVRNAEMRNFAYDNLNVNHNLNENFLQGDRKPWDKENWTWNHTNPGVKPYKFMDDVTFVGIPIFVAGWIAKSEKYGFKQQDKHSLVTNFKTGIDDYLQFFGPALTVGLKVGGLEGRSDWGRFLASTAMSYGIMAGFVNGIKYTAKEMRPDGSTANSWPSGHTATAFVGATILHKEYGLTRSPWYSVAGYTVATATGVMRVLNNRHWVSDVLSGAGIGIMSTELAYALSDVIFKGKGLLRNNLSTGKSIIDNPSFLSISMGVGFGSRNMDFDMGKFEFVDDDNDGRFNLKFGTSTAVGVEGAYFINKHVGFGGRVRVNSSPIKGWNNIINYAWSDIAEAYSSAETEDELDMIQQFIDLDKTSFTIQSDHLTEFAFDLGVYLNFPLSKRFALGTKFLVGRSVMQEINLEATLGGKVADYIIDRDPMVILTDQEYSATWDYFTVGGNNTFKTGTGISLTYAYKDNFAWRLFLDYDYTRKTYTMEYAPMGFISAASPTLYDAMMQAGFAEDFKPYSRSIKKDRNTFILGGSFTINF
ncbi:MAG: phosphatase PAP2 family protein [Prevotella sp.]|nr:phosphatase PAP2 family protein [Prevotella sp.]